MNYHRYKSEFLSWKVPYQDPRLQMSMNDQLTIEKSSKAYCTYRRDRIRSPDKSSTKNQHHKTEKKQRHDSNLSLHDSRLKREIIREVQATMPGSFKICIPIRTTSAPPNSKPAAVDNKNDEQLKNLRRQLERMKARIEQQDELIKWLQQQLEKDKETRTDVIRTVIPTMPFMEDPPAMELLETVWE
ncbi:unnamed protein product [Rotaria sordida]|uniref:Uncharacterized protein n=1 Tax=Rotaria sordida TaxID=392033 RepID=A0A816BSI2_9BILA|nr:unnamed protein product [Rotaria sordida]CAF1615343.1 unnamed protein product [Rotaria sordida]